MAVKPIGSYLPKLEHLKPEEAVSMVRSNRSIGHIDIGNPVLHVATIAAKFMVPDIMTMNDAFDRGGGLMVVDGTPTIPFASSNRPSAADMVMPINPANLINSSNGKANSQRALQEAIAECEIIKRNKSYEHENKKRLKAIEMTPLIQKKRKKKSKQQRLSRRKNR